MVSIRQVQFREVLRTVKSGEHLVDFRDEVSFSDDCFVGTTHIDTQSHVTVGASSKHDWTDPAGWTFNFFDDVETFESFEFVFKLLSSVKWDATKRLLYGCDVRVDV